MQAVEHATASTHQVSILEVLKYLESFWTYAVALPLE